jgi:hypothetical protein
MYHDLEADSEVQKQALIEGTIVLSPFELLVMTLFRALTDPSFVPDLRQSPAYFMDLEGNAERMQRFDKHRLLVITMTNFMSDLIEKHKENFGPQREVIQRMLIFWYWAFDEYCLQPVINLDRRSRTPSLTTPVIELIFMFISLGMHPETAFTKSNKSVSQFSPSAPLAAKGPVWDAAGPLEALKAKLYQFFECAFFSVDSSAQYLNQVRLCDVACLYYQILKPWDNSSEFMAFAMALDQVFDDKSRSLNADHIIKLVTPSVLNNSNVRSFAGYFVENAVEDEQLNETTRQKNLQADRAFWEKYAYSMSAFYFGLLSHMMAAFANKYDYDIEDAFIIQDVSKFFMKQELQEYDPQTGKKVDKTYYIDGIISESRF